MNNLTLPEAPQSIELRCVQVSQPIGTFFIAAIDSKLLCQITASDVRRMVEERPFETYLGIQRPLSAKRVREISAYVRTIDACFPTSVILSISSRCAQYDPDRGVLTLSNYIDSDNPDEQKLFIQIARVLDGQHRIEGLRGFQGTFDVNVSIFVDADIEDEAYLFSTVNLTQTKVNRSLVFDLFELAKTRSPQKVAHDIAVALDQTDGSPFFKKIKRLGTATPYRNGETLSQATFVQALLPYMSTDILKDRDLYLRGKRPALATGDELRKLLFRNMFLEEKELEITDVIWNYFEAVSRRWPMAWTSTGQGNMLNKTNGYRALMKLLKPTYLYLTGPGGVPSTDEFGHLFARSSMNDASFDIANFPPSSSGESKLFATLKDELKLV